MALGTQKQTSTHKRRTRSPQSVIIFFWRNAWWLSVVVSLLLLAERVFLLHIPVWVFAVISAGMAILAIAHSFGPGMVRSQFGQTIMRVILRDLLDSFDPEIVSHAKLCCNVMQLSGDTLTIVTAYPEKSDPKDSVQWTTMQGCCGQSIRNEEVIIQNFAEYRGKPYEALIRSEDGLPMWGITREQWEHTRDLGSIVSIPIFSFEALPVVIGVLNFDAYETTEAWLETEPYTKEQVLKRAMIVRRVLGLILMAHKQISAI